MRYDGFDDTTGRLDEADQRRAAQGTGRDRNLSPSLRFVRDEGPADVSGEPSPPAEQRYEPGSKPYDSGTVGDRRDAHPAANGPERSQTVCTAKGPSPSNLFRLHPGYGLGLSGLSLVTLLALLAYQMVSIRESRSRTDALEVRLDRLAGTLSGHVAAAMSDPLERLETRLDKLDTELSQLQALEGRVAKNRTDIADLADMVRLRTAGVPVAVEAELPTDGAEVESDAVAARPSTPPENLTAATQTKREVIPAAATHGPWAVSLIIVSDRDKAEKLRQQYEAKGVVSELQVIASSSGKNLYQLRVTGLSDQQAAEAEARRITDRLGLRDLWIARD